LHGEPEFNLLVQNLFLVPLQVDRDLGHCLAGT
jgi:hypothetical protein